MFIKLLLGTGKTQHFDGALFFKWPLNSYFFVHKYSNNFAKVRRLGKMILFNYYLL